MMSGPEAGMMQQEQGQAFPGPASFQGPASFSAGPLGETPVGEVPMPAAAVGPGPLVASPGHFGAGPLAGPMAGPLPGLMAGPVAGPMAGPIAGPMAGPLPGPMAGPLSGPMAGPVLGKRSEVPSTGKLRDWFLLCF